MHPDLLQNSQIVDDMDARRMQRLTSCDAIRSQILILGQELESYRGRKMNAESGCMVPKPEN